MEVFITIRDPVTETVTDAHECEISFVGKKRRHLNAKGIETVDLLLSLLYHNDVVEVSTKPLM